MARMIDASRFGEILEQWKKDCLEDNDIQGADIISDVILQLDDMPTLTQPNEPLTWEELEKLKNSPVYIEVIGVDSYWALVRDINDSGVWLMTVDDIDDYGSHRLYGKTWLAYRRPPEGEEDTQ